MNQSLPPDVSEELKLTFTNLQSNKIFHQPLQSVVELIKNGVLTKQSVSEILEIHGITKVEDIKLGILDLILDYINFILDDNYITNKEAEHVKYLKLFFKIKEGDFYNNRYLEIEKIVDRQLQKMYGDNLINNDEALQKVELQELFDLGYDQFLKISSKAIQAAIERGANVLDLDTFLNPKN